MENAELDRVNTALSNAHSPEEVFGSLAGTPAEMLESARSIFRLMAKSVHPDAFQENTDVDTAEVAFKKLVHFWELAQTRIANGSYGMTTTPEAFAPFVMRTKKRQYTVERLLTHGDLCGLYVGGSPLTSEKSQWLLKIPLKPQDNDLVANEARILGHLRASSDYKKLCHFVSQLADAFSYQEEATGIVRQVNVLSYVEGLYSLKEVREVYTHGIDPKDMAWIWRRLLVALGFAHTNNVLHGAVLPTHILLHPAQHGVVLIDWSYAVLDPAVTGERVSAISSPYREWYPAEVFAREEPTPGLDIFMAASCMFYLLGGDPEKRTLPATVPWQIHNYLKGCMLPNPQQRPQDVHDLLKEFDELIQRLWGSRTFRTFFMPKR